MIRKAEYYKESFNNKTHNMEEMWKELGNLLNTNKKKKSNSISKLIINNKELKNNKDIANALNKHFTAIGKSLAAKVIPQVNNSFKGQLQRFHKLISNDRIWASEHGFEVTFEKSLFVFEISAFRVRN